MLQNINQQFLIGLIIGSALILIPEEYRYLLGLIICPIILMLAFIDLIIMLYKKSDNLQVLEINQDKNMRCMKIFMVNNNLLEDQNLFRGIYNTIMYLEEFKNFSYDKIIILSVILATDKEHNLHSNILINNDTTFEKYYEEVQPELSVYNNLQYGYHNESISKFVIKVWDVDHSKNLKIKQTYSAVNKSTNFSVKGMQIRSFNTSTKLFNKNLSLEGTDKKWYRGLIQPISIHNKNGELKVKNSKIFYTLDLETIKFNDIQIPIAISSCGYNSKGNLDVKLFLIDSDLLVINLDKALKELWLKYFNYLDNIIKELNINKLTIFAHNLGEFDGYLLYTGLMMCKNPDNISSLIDESNSFISITHHQFEWKDSLRIFPKSLNELCKMFNVEGKSMSYNPKFSNINLFNNPKLFYSFKKYSKQDAIALFNALTSAQFLYWDKYKVDIVDVYSTATLSLKIFRTNFQEHSIYILPQHMDNFIRASYFGGGTDVYKAYGKKIYYYDVNSLYPFAMLNPMPGNLVHPNKIDLTNRKLDSFFGYAEAIITCPDNILRPVLPYHHEGKTIYPIGTWQGVYFSEELKAVEKLGYIIKLLKGYEFTKITYFPPYVYTFYDIKKNSTGTVKDMAKLQLNNLYGYFGRKILGIITQNINNKDLNNILLTRIVKSLTPINDDYTTVLTYSNINHNLLEKLNNEFHEIGSNKHFTMSNVALAAAVTAYSRIHMIPFKINPNTLYTDTDSVFMSEPLDPSLISDELGMMKDELKGQVIEEAYFLGPKKYGYYMFNKDGQRKEFSVFSGVPRNSLSFEEVKSIFEGKTITKNISNRFFKSINTLKISIKDTKISIKNTPHKKLVNNFYLPPKIYHGSGLHNLFNFHFNKFKNIIIRNYKKIYK